jgi:hypothetical protein
MVSRIIHFFLLFLIFLSYISTVVVSRDQLEKMVENFRRKFEFEELFVEPPSIFCYETIYFSDD